MDGWLRVDAAGLEGENDLEQLGRSVSGTPGNCLPSSRIDRCNASSSSAPGSAGSSLQPRCRSRSPTRSRSTLIDKNDSFVFGYAKLDVMFGRSTPEAVRLPYSAVAKPGVRILRETITAIDPGLAG